MADLKGQPMVKTPSRNTLDTEAQKYLRATRDGVLFTAQYLENLAMQGRIFYGSDSASNTTIASQTSFAATTPSLLLDVPSGTTAMPLFANLVQTGTVADTGPILVAIEIDNAGRFSSGGTQETVLASRTDQPLSNRCTLYSAPTAGSGYGVRVSAYQLGQDVSPAEGAQNGVFWTPPTPIFVVGPGAFLVFSWVAAGTAATWNWAVSWAEIPSTDLT